jgi:hypothetical protein
LGIVGEGDMMTSFSFESLFPGEKGREAPPLPFSFHIQQFLNLKKEEEGESSEEAELQEDKITTSQKDIEDEDKADLQVLHTYIYIYSALFIFV